MAGSDFIFNIGLGRMVELFKRVDTNDPANCEFVWVLLAAASIEADNILIDYDTLDVLLAGASNEATNTGYARIHRTDADITDPGPNDTSNRYDLDMTDLNFGSVLGDGTGAIGKALLCYDPDSTSGTDSTVVPLAAYAVSTTPDGNILQMAIANTGFFRATG